MSMDEVLDGRAEEVVHEAAVDSAGCDKERELLCSRCLYLSIEAALRSVAEEVVRKCEHAAFFEAPPFMLAPSEKQAEMRHEANGCLSAAAAIRALFPTAFKESV